MSTSSAALPIRSVIRSKHTYFAVFMIFSALLLYRITQSYSYTDSIWQAASLKSAFRAGSIMSDGSRPSRPPVYFLGIGGPNFMENPDHPAYAQLQSVGREITEKVKPKAVVVFSAHWQSGPSKIQINVAEQTDIIYDFYGFPAHYYEYKYPNRGSPEVASKVIEKLTGAGIEVEKVQRGLDHGVWAGFVVAFDPEKNPLNVPIVQVSLYSSEDPDQHYRLGHALESLRDEGILIIGTGMAVHNLRDFRAIRGTGQTMPYAFTFDEALKEATTAEPEERQDKMSTLLKRSLARQAHPTMEHILPIYIAAGAAGSDAGERLWTLAEGSLSWAQYRFGKIATA